MVEDGIASGTSVVEEVFEIKTEASSYLVIEDWFVIERTVVWLKRGLIEDDDMYGSCDVVDESINYNLGNTFTIATSRLARVSLLWLDWWSS